MSVDVGTPADDSTAEVALSESALARVAELLAEAPEVSAETRAALVALARQASEEAWSERR
jgi:hypothetical protein